MYIRLILRQKNGESCIKQLMLIIMKLIIRHRWNLDQIFLWYYITISYISMLVKIYTTVLTIFGNLI
jgi:hypothetical protein